MGRLLLIRVVLVFWFQDFWVTVGGSYLLGVPVHSPLYIFGIAARQQLAPLPQILSIRFFVSGCLAGCNFKQHYGANSSQCEAWWILKNCVINFKT